MVGSHPQTCAAECDQKQRKWDNYHSYSHLEWVVEKLCTECVQN